MRTCGLDNPAMDSEGPLGPPPASASVGIGHVAMTLPTVEVRSVGQKLSVAADADLCDLGSRFEERFGAHQKGV